MPVLLTGGVRAREEEARGQEPAHGPAVADQQQDAEVEIRRYPAYNFVDTTIKRSSARLRMVQQPAVQPRLVSPPTKSFTPSVSAATPSKAPKSPLVGAGGGEAWELKGEGLDDEGKREGEKEDEVFHSEPLHPSAAGVVTPSGLSPSVVRARRPLGGAGGAQRPKRFSETDASRYTHPLGALLGPTASVTTDTPSLTRSNRYDVVIRAPEGRRYYVLETSRPSVFFGRQDSAPAPRWTRTPVEHLAPDQIMMLRAEPRGTLDRGHGGAGRGQGWEDGADEVPLRRYLYGADCTVTCV